jgi:serine O-acetyltransferase
MRTRALIQNLYSDFTELPVKILREDRAYRSLWEARLCSRGLWCVVFHRISHYLFSLGLFLAARLIARSAEQLFSIEIHPGAQLGRRVYIDHGWGTVIGEDCVIEDDVTLYHRVTLGSLRATDTFPRHPHIGKASVIGCGATLLGPLKIEAHSKISAGAFLKASSLRKEFNHVVA